MKRKKKRKKKKKNTNQNKTKQHKTKQKQKQKQKMNNLFNNFLQITSVDTLILSSNGPYDNFTFDWENTQSTQGDSFYYFIEFFLDFETVFSDTLISSSQDSATYSGAEIYQGMLGVDGDTILGCAGISELAIDHYEVQFLLVTFLKRLLSAYFLNIEVAKNIKSICVDD